MLPRSYNNSVFVRSDGRYPVLGTLVVRVKWFTGTANTRLNFFFVINYVFVFPCRRRKSILFFFFRSPLYLFSDVLKIQTLYKAIQWVHGDSLERFPTYLNVCFCSRCILILGLRAQRVFDLFCLTFLARRNIINLSFFAWLAETTV